MLLQGPEAIMLQMPEVLLQLPGGCRGAAAVLPGSLGPSCCKFPEAIILQGTEAVMLNAPDVLMQMSGGNHAANSRGPGRRKCPEAVVFFCSPRAATQVGRVPAAPRQRESETYWRITYPQTRSSKDQDRTRLRFVSTLLCLDQAGKAAGPTKNSQRPFASGSLLFFLVWTMVPNAGVCLRPLLRELCLH